MSLSNQRKQSPVEKYIEWSGSEGKFYFYDREEKKKVYYDEPIHIVVLDQLSCITGFSDEKQCGYFSNEVRSVVKEPLIVRYTKNAKIAGEGFYKDIKSQLSGANFTKSVYAAKITKENIECVNIKFSGSSIGPFIDAKIGDDGAIIILSPSTDQLKKGATVYFAPKIKKSQIRQDIIDRCIDMDKDLQEYFSGRQQQPEGKVYEPVEEKEANIYDGMENEDPKQEEDNFDDLDDLPF